MTCRTLYHVTAAAARTRTSRRLASRTWALGSAMRAAPVWHADIRPGKGVPPRGPRPFPVRQGRRWRPADDTRAVAHPGEVARAGRRGWWAWKAHIAGLSLLCAPIESLVFRFRSQSLPACFLRDTELVATPTFPRKRLAAYCGVSLAESDRVVRSRTLPRKRIAVCRRLAVC
jgi:hypothetical protein